MSWGVQTKADVYVSRVAKNSVDSKIEENEDLINIFEKEISILVALSPKDIVSEEASLNGNIESELRAKIDELLEAYKSVIKENCLLNIIKDNFEEAEDC